MTSRFAEHGIDRAYAAFYHQYLAGPPIQGLFEMCGASLPPPDQFSTQDAVAVCAAAFHGHYVFPPNLNEVRDRMKDGAPYAKVIEARLADFRDRAVPHMNAVLRRVAMFSGAELTIEIEDDKPFTRLDFEAVGFTHEPFIEAALQYERDRAYFAKNHRKRLDHYAADFGFADFNVFESFFEQLDIEANNRGHESYSHLVLPSRFLHLLRARHADAALLKEVDEKKAFLVQQSAFVIECFFNCRTSGTPFRVDVGRDGVMAALSTGPYRGVYTWSCDYSSDMHGVLDPGAWS